MIWSPLENTFLTHWGAQRGTPIIQGLICYQYDTRCYEYAFGTTSYSVLHAIALEIRMNGGTVRACRGVIRLETQVSLDPAGYG